MALTSVVSAEAASRVFVIHGIPGVPVDVYASAAGQPVPSTPTIPSFQPKQIVEVQAGPGQFRHPDLRTRCESPDRRRR